MKRMLYILPEIQLDITLSDIAYEAIVKTGGIKIAPSRPEVRGIEFNAVWTEEMINVSDEKGRTNVHE